MSFKSQYKSKGLKFGGAEEQRQLRIIKKNATRKDIRRNAFLKERNILSKDDHDDNQSLDQPQLVKKNGLRSKPVKKNGPDTEVVECTENIHAIPESRREKLKRWKEEKMLLKKLQNEKTKPIFKVGAVTHDKTPRMSSTVNSRIKKTVKEEAAAVKDETEVRRVTRSMTAKTSNKTSSARPLKLPLSKSTASSKSEKTKTADTVTKKVTRRGKSFAPDDFKFMVPGNLINLSWEPKPLTPRTSQQFIFSSGSSARHPSNSPVLEILAPYVDSGSDPTIDYASLKPKVGSTKIMRTPIKANILHDSIPEEIENESSPNQNDKEDYANPKNDTVKNESLTESKQSPENEPSMLSSIYFQKCKREDTPEVNAGSSRADVLASLEDTPVSSLTTNMSSYLDTPNIKNDQASISDSMAKIALDGTPVRNLRSSKKISLLCSPAPNSANFPCINNDLMSFSPMNK